MKCKIMTMAKQYGSLTDMTIKPTFFATPADFRAWLEEHHAKSQELWVGY